MNSRIGYFNAMESLPKQNDLRALLVEKTLDCIRIKNIIPQLYLNVLASNVIEKSRPHDRILDLAIMGNTYYQAAKGGVIADDYFDSQEKFAVWVRQNSNGVSPLDIILGIFSSMHSRGIAPGALDDKREMPSGIFRVYPAEKGTEILPHQDILYWDVKSNIAKALEGQAGWNIYLDIPTHGGELVIYNYGLEQCDYKCLAGENYGISWLDAGAPVLSIFPEIGELILIDTCRLHAIKKVFGKGHRVTLSGFLGYSETNGLMSWA